MKRTRGGGGTMRCSTRVHANRRIAASATRFISTRAALHARARAPARCPSARRHRLVPPLSRCRLAEGHRAGARARAWSAALVEMKRVALAAILLFACTRVEQRIVPPPPRVLFIGLDGADWQLLDQYCADGTMPNL